MKSKDMEKTVKKAKLTVKKYLEKTGSKSNNIIRKGARPNQKTQNLEKPQSSKTLKVKENTWG